MSHVTNSLCMLHVDTTSLHMGSEFIMIQYTMYKLQFIIKSGILMTTDSNHIYYLVCVPPSAVIIQKF